MLHLVVLMGWARLRPTLIGSGLGFVLGLWAGAKLNFLSQYLNMSDLGLLMLKPLLDIISTGRYIFKNRLDQDLYFRPNN